MFSGLNLLGGIPFLMFQRSEVKYDFDEIFKEIF